MSALKIVGAVVVGLVLLAFVVTYSWTFTPLGRLDYSAAVISKLSEWQTAPPVLTPEARASSNEMVRGFMPGEATPLDSIEDRVAVFGGNEVPVRVYTPKGEGPLPLYLDIHGGGWWMGDGYPFESATTRLAADSGAVIVSVDYRLAPEHPFPAAIDDVWVALNWMHENAAALNGDASRIGIGGGSAGGNLAAALALRARDEGGPEIAFQYLMVPATDLTDETDWPSYREAGERYMLKVSGISHMVEAYVPDPALRDHPFVSPLQAESHEGLPPALIITAHFDPLRDQGAAYAQKLEAAGVPVEYHNELGAIHGFVGSPDRMLAMQARAAAALRKALARQGESS